MERERRSSARFVPVQQQTLRACELPQSGISLRHGEPILGWIENVSRTGICIRTLTMLSPHRMVRCEISVPETPVSIPTLAQVCWTCVDDDVEICYAGLQFVL